MNEGRFHEKFEKIGIENTEEQGREQGKELNPEEIKELSREMKEYGEGLLERVNEIKDELKIGVESERAEKLRAELSDLEEQLSGLEEFVSDVEGGGYEEITAKDI